VDRDPGHIGKGIVVGFGLTAAGGLIIAVTSSFPLVAIGLFQILWMGPAFCIYLGKGKTQTALGVLAAAGLIFILCIGLCGVALRSGGI
jgi:hypothetical protein